MCMRGMPKRFRSQENKAVLADRLLYWATEITQSWILIHSVKDTARK